ncbi:hypothetical protein BV25DRAFT_993669 [Artomyces pyxidatus]|uniref:Uncharacterized protein n=1 Tax=Artomyces pyxidatus TaxID=48021 RepID=A0ACB8STZ8_9AGAM|nr:hypothetical protein BV25DRAFT_993669 [Artomyces pyxidatus]
MHGARRLWRGILFIGVLVSSFSGSRIFIVCMRGQISSTCERRGTCRHQTSSCFLLFGGKNERKTTSQYTGVYPETRHIHYRV